MTVLRWPPFYWTWTMISTISCSDMKGWSNMKSDMNAHYALLSQVWDEHSKRVLFHFFSWFLSWSFDVLWFLFDGFTTFHNFCQLLSPFLKCSQLFRYKKNRRRVSQCSGAEGEDEEAVLSTNDVVLELSAGHLLSFHSPYTSWFLKGLGTILMTK